MFIEIIIIDDGSDIPLNRILKSSYLKKIILFRNKKNEGVSYSLNKGIELSTGNFICRLDADDVMLPNRIKSQIDFLIKNPEYACVCGQIKTMSGIDYYRYPTYFNSICIGSLFGNPIAHPTVMFRSEIIKKYRYLFLN